MLHNYVITVSIVCTQQVIIPCPSDRYTGQVYYERIGYSRWLMKFIVVRDIDAFIMVRTSIISNYYIIVIIIL